MILSSLESWLLLGALWANAVAWWVWADAR